jgi:hypothetical protein
VGPQRRALVGALLLGWPAGLAGSPPPGGEELGVLRESAREALRTSCGRCHDRAEPTARPAALRIFDLAEIDWSARVTEAQMDHIEGRFEGFKMPEADRVTVRRFLDAERARRATLAATPPGDAPPR